MPYALLIHPQDKGYCNSLWATGMATSISPNGILIMILLLILVYIEGRDLNGELTSERMLDLNTAFPMNSEMILPSPM